MEISRRTGTTTSNRPLTADLGMGASRKKGKRTHERGEEQGGRGGPEPRADVRYAGDGKGAAVRPLIMPWSKWTPLPRFSGGEGSSSGAAAGQASAKSGRASGQKRGRGVKAAAAVNREPTGSVVAGLRTRSLAGKKPRLGYSKYFSEESSSDDMEEEEPLQLVEVKKEEFDVEAEQIQQQRKTTTRDIVQKMKQHIVEKVQKKKASALDTTQEKEPRLDYSKYFSEESSSDDIEEEEQLQLVAVKKEFDVEAEEIQKKKQTTTRDIVQKMKQHIVEKVQKKKGICFGDYTGEEAG